MNISTFVAGSFPKIVTSGSPRRKNEEGIYNNFLRGYIKTLADLLLQKKSLKDIKFTYIGGYEGIENTNTAKLYFSALNYYFKSLGYGELSKNNFAVIEEKDYINDRSGVINLLENTDFYMLGLGDDALFGHFLELFEKDGVSLSDIMVRNNALVTSVCSGSVVSGMNIYGGKYDSFYHNRPEFDYPQNYPSLNFNLVTMETNLYPESQSEEKNKKFKEECLIPDSKKITFFGCRPNSFIIMNNQKIVAVGEIYLFIDGDVICICNSDNKMDITKLNELVNLYNTNKNLDVKKRIFIEIEGLANVKNLDDYTDYFALAEKQIEGSRKMVKELLQKQLEENLNNLAANSKKELVISSNLLDGFIEGLNLKSTDSQELVDKYNLVVVINKLAKLYGNNYSAFFNDLYFCFWQMAGDSPELVLYFIECFSSFYENKDMKKLLAQLCLQPIKRINALSSTNCYFKRSLGLE